MTSSIEGYLGSLLQGKPSDDVSDSDAHAPIFSINRLLLIDIEITQADK